MSKDKKPVVVIKTPFDDAEGRIGPKKLLILALLIAAIGGGIIFGGKYYIENRKHVIAAEIVTAENGIYVFAPIDEEEKKHGHDEFATNPDNVPVKAGDKVYIEANIKKGNMIVRKIEE